jgi:hypothetical protein
MKSMERILGAVRFRSFEDWRLLFQMSLRHAVYMKHTFGGPPTTEQTKIYWWRYSNYWDATE